MEWKQKLVEFPIFLVAQDDENFLTVYYLQVFGQLF